MWVAVAEWTDGEYPEAKFWGPYPDKEMAHKMLEDLALMGDPVVYVAELRPERVLVRGPVIA